jgi:hypothetical protein
MLFAGRNHIGDKFDLIEAFWEPAKPGVCRVHAVWRVAESKATLVYWGEAIDCARGKWRLQARTRLAVSARSPRRSAA